MKILCQASNTEEGATTILRRSRGEVKILAPKCHAPLIEGDDIVYSPNKYRETEGIKEIFQLLVLLQRKIQKQSMRSLLLQH